MMEAITSYNDIKKFSNREAWAADMGPKYMLDWIAKEEEIGLLLEPGFRRGHVWTREQQSAYIEYVLLGGKNGLDLYFNCPWRREGVKWPWWEAAERKAPGYTDYVCMDGLQRIAAWKAFFQDKVRVFGMLESEIKGRFPENVTMRLHVMDYRTEKEVLFWYLGVNFGGTAHAESEKQRIEKMRDGLL